MPNSLRKVIEPKKKELWWMYHPESDSLFFADINSIYDPLCEPIQKISRGLSSEYQKERDRINKKLRRSLD